MSAPFVVPIDPARVQDARSAARTLLLLKLALVLLGVVGLVLAQVWDLRLYTTIICGVLILAGLAAIAMGTKRKRQLTLATADPAQVAFAADEEGITLAGLARIPWDEVLAVSALDDRPRMSQRRGLTALFDGLSERSGAGLLAIAVIIRHGKEYREALPDAGQQGRITVHGKPHPSDGLIHGWTTLLVDTLVPMVVADGCVRVAIQAAQARGIDTGEFTKQMDFVDFNGKRVDPTWG